MGINGDFAAGSRTYNWEIAANYGYSRDVNRVPSYVFQNVLNALNATTDGSGNIICTSGYANSPVATGSSHRPPLDIFQLGTPRNPARQDITHNTIAPPIHTPRAGT